MVLLSDKHPINLTIGQELPPTFHYAWVILSTLRSGRSYHRPSTTPGSSSSLAGQTAAPLRTAWGDPDLQGTFTNKTITPFERPTELAGKEFLTVEEVAELEQIRAAANAARDSEVPADIVGNYNSHWFDRGTTVVGTRRTSIIIDPPDGRLPSLTLEAKANAPSPEEVQRLARGNSEGKGPHRYLGRP